MFMTTAISLLLLLLLSAFFSSSETAYFNLRKHRGNFSSQVKDIIKVLRQKVGYCYLEAFGCDKST